MFENIKEAMATIREFRQRGRQSECSDLLGLDEFELIDRLATMVGVAGPESQEERNTSPAYQRRVLRKAIAALERAWQN